MVICALMMVQQLMALIQHIFDGSGVDRFGVGNEGFGGGSGGDDVEHNRSKPDPIRPCRRRGCHELEFEPSVGFCEMHWKIKRKENNDYHLVNDRKGLYSSFPQCILADFELRLRNNFANKWRLDPDGSHLRWERHLGDIKYKCKKYECQCKRERPFIDSELTYDDLVMYYISITTAPGPERITVL